MISDVNSKLTDVNTVKADLVFPSLTAMVAPPLFSPGEPALCGSHALVTPY